MYQLRYVQEVYHTYLVLEVDPLAPGDSYGVRILQNNTLASFAPFQVRSKDGKEEYYYDISGYQNITDQLEKGITGDNMTAFATAVIDALEECSNYLLMADDILLDKSCIFYSDEQHSYRFVYYPGHCQNVLLQLKSLAEIFLKSVDYTSQASVRKVYEFYHTVCDNSSPLQKLKHFSVSQDIQKPLQMTESTPEMSTPLSFSADDAVSHSEPLPRRILTDFAPMEEDPPTETLSKIKCPPFRFFLVIGVSILLELIIVYCIFRMGPRLNDSVYLISAGVLMAATAIVGFLVWHFRQKKKDTDDFWSPEDYIDYGTNAADISRGSDSTTLLKDDPAGVNPVLKATLKSCRPKQYPDMHILSFPAIIGKEVRDPACRIEESTVSRKHARLEYRSGQFRLTDLRSSNGTFINGELIAPMEPMAIKSGDSIIFSDLEFVFDSTAAR